MGALSDIAGRSGMRHRLALELSVLVAVGTFLGLIGPFGSERVPFALRMVYWLACIVGGGAIGIGFDASLGQRIASHALRILLMAVAMTPAVTLLVQWLGVLLLDAGGADLAGYLDLLWQVFVIALPVMALRALVLHRPAPLVETRTVIAPPLPEAEVVFRRRLSAPRRAARLIAVEAHDHYLRVHTDAGVELITLRFADALAELAAAHGLRVHRSWWVAADAIEGVRWRRGSGELRLAGGLIAPVSRSHAPALKEAGWF